MTEMLPTPDQLKNILDYANATGARKTEPGDVIRGARNAADALRKLREEGEGVFVRPVVGFLSSFFFFYFSFLLGVCDLFLYGWS